MTKLSRINLYKLGAILELATGAALVVCPALVMQLLFGSPLGSGGDHVAQLYGLALLGLGVACWGDSCADQSQKGLMMYNSVAAIVLISFAVRGIAAGLMVWPAGLMHLALGSLMVWDLFSS